jgi:hypothetical protein
MLLDKRKKSVEKHLGVRIDSTSIRSQIDAWILRTLSDGLSMAAAAGALGFGADAVASLLRQQMMPAGLFAKDAAERTVRKARAAATDEIEWLVVPWTRAELGAFVGRGPVAVIGVRHSRATTFLLRQLRRSLRLG